MQDHKTHIYFVPGMAANAKIFENIKLPESDFEVHYLEWVIPLEKETLEAYALRMTKYVVHENAILLGVSFGGILVQEMSRFIATKKVVVISSVLHEKEFPYRMRFAKRTKVYKLLPTSLFSDVDKLVKYAFGETIKGRAELYKKYLSVSDEKYLTWAIEQIVNWKQTQKLANVVHIHGNKDKVFPVENIKGDVIRVKNGTHIMIINKYKWFNENLPELLSI
ncbi:MAG: alpha/beta hydrolase [Flavobacteriaceae bacterium]|nr:alpha/beta hydrolase [Flavobacteriaceae bacterium]